MKRERLRNDRYNGKSVIQISKFIIDEFIIIRKVISLYYLQLIGFLYYHVQYTGPLYFKISNKIITPKILITS